VSDDKLDIRAQALELYKQGLKLVDIAKALDVPDGTVRRWKHSDKWDEGGERSLPKRTKKANVLEANEKANVLPNRRKRTLQEVAQALASPVGNSKRAVELTDKQLLFCMYYVKSFNATKSYQKAYGCAYTTAMTKGSELMRNPEVRKKIMELKKNRFNREMLKEEDIIQKYMDIAFGDIGDYVTFGQEEVEVMGAFGPIMVEDPDTGEKVPLTKVVNVVRLKESEDVDGTLISEIKGGKNPGIKMLDRMKALEWLAEHIGIQSDEQKARIDKLRAEADRIRRDGTFDEDDGVVIINDAPD